MRRFYWLLLFLLVSTLTYSQKKREMRGVWIATVANIDWPSSRDSSSSFQKQELILLLDSLSKCGINTVIFQIRPTADALYRSDIEPWSEWLTGEQGKSPDDSSFDPLQVVVEESHKRCMEVHAWINPYRVTNTPKSKLTPNHIYYKKPYLFKQYGDKIFFDPGQDETADYLLKVLKDILVRYDIDAFHLDDYFYPYPVGGKDFPDEETFKKNPNGFTNKADWRRDNVNRIVMRIQQMVKEEKSWVQFGVSPFGVWRNKAKDEKGSDTKAGVTNYDDLYADVWLWAEKGWIDYIAPQLYWEIGKSVADYAILAPWWRANVPASCQLYFGLYASGLEVNKPKAWKTPNELVRQMKFNQECVDIEGLLFYSTHYLLRNPQGLLDSLKTQYYAYPALPLEMKTSAEAHFPLNLRLEEDSVLRWDPVVAEGGESVSYYVVYAFPDSSNCDFDDPKNIITKTTETAIDLKKIPGWKKSVMYNLTVTSVNRFRKESDPYEFVLYVGK